MTFTASCQLDFSCIYLLMTFYPDAGVVILCFITGVNVRIVYVAPQDIPSAIVLTLGNEAELYCITK